MTDKHDPAKSQNKTTGLGAGATPGPNPGGMAGAGSTGGPAMGAAGGSAPGTSSGQPSGSTGTSGTGTSGTGKSGTGASGTEGHESLKETVRQTASDATAAAREMASEQADRARDAVAEEVSGVAHALRAAADDLRDGSPQERTFAHIADTLADAAEAIRGKDLGEMVQDATRMARRHPMTFLGGAALLGFTAVRFARASRGEPARPAQRRGAGYRTAENRPGPTTAPARPASPGVAEARRMP